MSLMCEQKTWGKELSFTATASEAREVEGEVDRMLQQGNRSSR